jgi:iron-sulfur cluster insertion protein
MRFSISDTAAERVHTLLKQNPSSHFLRIRVSGGGCSGFQYHFVLDETTTEDDQLFEKNGAKIAIDEMSLGLLDGSEVDFVEDLAAASFVIRNPNAASSCGCGNSFSV